MLTPQQFILQANIRHLKYRRVPEDHDPLSADLEQYPLEWAQDWWTTDNGHWRLYWSFTDVSLYPHSPLAKEYFRQHFLEETAVGKDHAYHSILATLHIIERFNIRNNES